MLRLVQALQATQHNPDWVPRLLLLLLPVPVQTMVLSIDPGSLQTLQTQVQSSVSEGSVLNCMVQAWWEYNGRTPFFSHHLTAKLVRRVLKREREAALLAIAGAAAGAAAED